MSTSASNELALDVAVAAEHQWAAPMLVCTLGLLLVYSF
jgi:hypothetical protein